MYIICIFAVQCTCIIFFYLHPVEKRKENITDLPRQGGQKKKMGEHSAVNKYMYYCSTDNFRF